MAKRALHSTCKTQLAELKHGSYFCPKCELSGEPLTTIQRNDDEFYVFFRKRPLPPKRKAIRILFTHLASNLGEATKILIAMIVWTLLVVFAAWYKSGGFWIVWLVVAPVLCLLGILSESKPIAPIARPFRLVSDWIMDAYKEKIAYAGLVLPIAAVAAFVYVVLMAPYGLLCHLGLRTCGQKGAAPLAESPIIGGLSYLGGMFVFLSIPLIVGSAIKRIRRR